MAQDDLADRLASIRETIAVRQRVGGWTHPVRLIAVTKTHGAESVKDALAAGMSDVGENRVQEALGKQDELSPLPIAWHLIGGLQTRKAKLVVGRFALVQSVDRLELASELDRRAAAAGVVQAVLVQVNCSGEPQKGGVLPDALPALLDALQAHSALAVRGLMTMAAFSEDEAVQRRAFASLRALAESGRRAGHALPELSMGMSGDYPVAVEEGATMVRLGTVLFGKRD